jgi:ribosomal protein S7
MSDSKKENKNSIVENIVNSISEFAKKNNWTPQKIENNKPKNEVDQLQNSPLNRYWGKSK